MSVAAHGDVPWDGLVSLRRSTRRDGHRWFEAEQRARFSRPDPGGCSCLRAVHQQWFCGVFADAKPPWSYKKSWCPGNESPAALLLSGQGRHRGPASSPMGCNPAPAPRSARHHRSQRSRSRSDAARIEAQTSFLDGWAQGPPLNRTTPSALDLIPKKEQEKIGSIQSLCYVPTCIEEAVGGFQRRRALSSRQ